MKARHSVRLILTGALLLPGLTACSIFGGDGEPAEEVAAEGEEGEAAEPIDVAGTDSVSADPEALGTDEVIGSTTEENLAASDPTANLGVPGAETGLPSDIPPEVAGNAAIPAPTESLPMDPGTVAPPATLPVSGDVRVYYVSSSGVPLRDRPAADGTPVGSLSQGDPVLVKIEGNWANIVNRGWVELSSLSMGPVARAKNGKSWN